VILGRKARGKGEKEAAGRERNTQRNKSFSHATSPISVRIVFVLSDPTGIMPNAPIPGNETTYMPPRA
jgi:hypothetical protein